MPTLPNELLLRHLKCFDRFGADELPVQAFVGGEARKPGYRIPLGEDADMERFALKDPVEREIPECDRQRPGAYVWHIRGAEDGLSEDGIVRTAPQIRARTVLQCTEH